MKPDTPTVMLFWVKAEIDHALKGIRERIARHDEAPGDVTALRTCPGQLHQVAGALRIFELTGVLRFTGALEAAFAKVLAEGNPGRKTMELLDRSVLALGDFVDGLSKGALNAPLRLYPLYRDLSALDGKTHVTRKELFHPDLKISAPRHASDRVLATAALPEFLQAQRTRYQRALLTWMRNLAKTDGLQEMRQALDALDQVAPQLPEPQALWWCAVGLVDALLHTPRPEWIALAKTICTRIDLQLRNLAIGAKTLDNQVLRDILYALVACRPVAPRMREVRQRFNLDSLLPGPDAQSVMDAAPDWRRAALGEVRARLETVKDAWVEYVSGKPEQLARFRELVTALKGKVGELNSEPLARLLEVVVLVAMRLPDPYPRDSLLLVMEMASAFLLAESIVEQINEPPADLDQQIVIMNGWLLDAAKTNTVCEPPAGLRADLIQKYNEAHLRAQVTREIVTNLQTVEEVLDAFARDPDRLDTLPALTPTLKQVHGAVIMLGFRRASALLTECEKMIDAALVPDQEDPLQDIHWIAEGLSTLGLYLEPCLRGRAPVEQPIDRFFERFGQREAEQAPPSGDLLDSTEAAVPARTPEAAPAAVQAAASAVAPAAPAAEPVMPPVDTTNAPGNEMLDIFLEEAEEVLVSITAAHAQCLRRADDRDALTVIRRGFHTLKGSGRMVGLKDLGEVAWEIEQVMNRWLERQHLAAPALLELVASATAAFADWVAQLKTGTTARIESDAIVAAAQELRRLDAAPAAQRPAAPAGRAAPVAAALLTAAPESGAESGALADELAALGAATRPSSLDDAATPEGQQAAGMVSAGSDAGADPTAAASDTHGPDADPEVLARLLRTNAGSMPPSTMVETGDAESNPPSLDPLAAGAAPAATPDPASEPDVVIGGVSLSRGFYDIYLREALQYLETLEIEFRGNRAQPDDPPSHEFIRAAHTLASISRTAGFDAISALAGALETWTSHAHRTPGADQVGTITGAISRLREMLASIERREPPRPANAEAKALLELPGQRAPAPILTATPVMPPRADAAIIAMAAEAPRQRDQRAIRDDLDAQLLPIFIEEARELLPQIGNDLRAWRANPGNVSPSHSVKRALHTLKGGARMAGAMRLGELTHLMESAVETALESGVPDTAVLERLEDQMDRLGHDIERLQPVGAAPEMDATQAHAREPARAEPPLPGPAAMLRIGTEALDRVVNESGEISIARSRIESELRTLKRSLADLSDSITRLRGQLREMEIQADSQMQSRMSILEQDRNDFDPLEFDRYTRLQELTRMMAEGLHDVVTVQQTLLKNVDEAEAALLQQARISRDLQQELMRVRTVPFANLTERLHRIVRQSARELGKKANLEIRGSQIELDRSVLERIAAPLEHLLRNAIAHGLESTDERHRLGKRETGEVTVALRQAGDEIVITVSDDGAGLDLEKLRRKGLETGLLRPGQEASEEELTQLIFAPGFSTAEEVTELVGRGVGMDVVRSEITAIGGRVEIGTVPGEGTRFSVYLPLTLAVTQAVLIRGAQHLFAASSAMIEQVLRLKADALAEISARGAAEFQGHTYPLHRLSHLIGVAQTAPEPRPYHSVLLVRSGTHRIALHVDELIRNQEVVIKNIGAQLSRAGWISGATVLADGKIVLIINPVQLAQGAQSGYVQTEFAPPALAVAVPRAPVVMVVDDSLTVRKITGRLLEREGYRVLTAKDGVDALEQVEAARPDLMLMDIEMPRMDGFDLARNIRTNPTTANVPIIMISSRSAQKHRNHALELGVNAFIGKPYQESELLAQIVEFTGGRRPQAVYH